VFVSESAGVDPADRWSIDPWGIACARGKWLVGQCVLPSTQTTYSVGWRRWLRYSSEMTIDPYLDNPPSDWFQSRRIYSFPVASVLNFMFQLFFVDKLAASTIGVYLSAMKYRFNCENCDTEWFGTFAITKARSALTILCRQRKAASEIGRLPFSLDLIEVYRKHNLQHLYRPRAIYTAMRLAHLLMLRISEYTIQKGKHFIRSQDVTFTLANGTYVTSSHVTSEIDTQVTGVLINIRSAKNDSHGAGHRFYFARNPSDPSRCICSCLFEWAVMATPAEHHPFFSYRSKWRLSRQEMSAALKGVASQVNLHPDRISPHSLRYGGASALAAANMPSYLIQQLGRWKSLAFLQYIHISDSLLASAQSVLANPSVFTLRDIQHLHPGCKLKG
jgi:integrase